MRQQRPNLEQPKILFVIDNLVTGGAEQVFADIAALMHGVIAFDVLLILPKEEEAYTLPAGIKKIYLNRRNKWSLKSMIECYAILIRYKVVHIHLRHTFRYLSLVSKFMPKAPKLILHDHSGRVKIDRSPPFILSRFFKPDVYIGVSETLQKWAIDVWKIDPDKTHVLVNLPSKRFLNSLDIPRTNDHRKDLVMVGNIKENKNQKLAIEIALAKGYGIDLVGKNQDEAYYAYLKSMANNNDIGFLEDIDDVSKILPCYRIGLFTSIYESGPLVVLEYLLCGLPFLAFKCGGISEIAARYFPQYFIDNFEKTEWLKRLSEIEAQYNVVDSKLVHKMIAKEFDRNIYCQRLLEIYAE